MERTKESDVVQKMRHVLRQHGITQTKFAGIVGCNRIHLNAIFIGDRVPGPALAYRISKALSFDILPDELLYGIKAVECYREVRG